MPTRTITAESRLLNRELSWVEFNARVLDLACDEEQPLLERVKFCSIFSSNLDEFFMVRVAGLMGQEAAGFAVRSADGMTPAQALADIKARVTELTGRQARLWKRELRPELAAEGIEIATIEECTPKELQRLEAIFTRDIYPVLTPLAVGTGHQFPYISGLSLSLGVLATDPDTAEERFARVKVPEGLDRFVDSGKRLVPLESVIAHYLPSLFPGMEIAERVLFRVTRDADFDVSDDADDLLEAVESELRRRRFGDVIRVEVSASASAGMLERLREGLGVREDQIYEIEGLLDLADLMQLLRLDRPDLQAEPWVPITQPRLARAKDAARFFDEVRRGDLLVHQPYESFRTSFEAFAAAAAADPDVIAMKTAVYRTSDDSALVSALIDCAEDGKQAVCLVELKARFDERRNIEWSRELEQAGVHVVHGFPDMKIHAKMTLVVRREAGGLRRYVHIGTGNYHASTARLYEDVGLFTADEEIAADVADVFNYVTGFGRPQKFRKLLVAPFEMRARLVEEIRAVTAAANRGRACPDHAQAQQPRRPDPDRRAVRGVRRRGHRGHLRAVGVHAPAGGRWSVGEHPRPLHPGAIPRAQPYLLVRGGDARLDVHRERRPDAAQPRSPGRGSRPGGERACAAGATGDPRERLCRRRARLGARGRRLLGADRAGQGGKARRPSGGDDAARTAAFATPDGRPRTQEPLVGARLTRPGARSATL